jgi:hypothetical protein
VSNGDQTRKRGDRGGGRPVREANGEDASDHSGLAFLVKGFSLIAAVLAILGVSGGTTGRMLRNEEAWALIAFIATLLAVIAGVIGGALKDEPRRQWWTLIVGLVLFAIAGVAAIIAGVAVWDTRPAPSVAVSVNATRRGDLLRLAVKDSGLEAGDRLTLAVWPLSGATATEVLSGEGPARSEYSFNPESIPIYEDVLGPDAEGNVEASPHALLPLGHTPQILVDASVGDSNPHDCTSKESEAGCVILDLGNGGQPQLRASWMAGHPRPVLRLVISARGLGPSPLHAIVLGKNPDHHRQLAAAILAPGPAGAVKQRMEVPVPAAMGEVCAAVSPAPISHCPPRPARQSLPELALCVESQKKNLPSDELPSEQQMVQSCRIGYARHVAEGTAWERVRTP